MSQVMSLESFTVGAVDYRLKMKKLHCVVVQMCCSLLVSPAGCRYQALLASTSTPHLNVQPDCERLSCIVMQAAGLNKEEKCED